MVNTYTAGVFLTISTYRGPFLAFQLFDSSVEPENFNHIKNEEDEIDWSDQDSLDSDNEDFPLHLDDTQFNKPQGIHMNPKTSQELPHNLDKEFLAELLSPPRAMCNKRFSFSVDDWVFVGAPVHILDSGTWRTLKEPDNLDQLKSVVTENDSPMRMFHVCFVLNPPINESKVCEERIYRFILAPFVKILRNEQALNNYVWRQATQMMNQSSHSTRVSHSRASATPCELAKSLTTLCSSVMQMEIANITVNGKARSFQVPRPLESDQIPSWFDTEWPSTCLSSCNLPNKEITHSFFNCYGLLLLDTPDKVIQEIGVDPGSAIGRVITAVDPSLSIEQLSKRIKIDAKQMSNLMNSLVYWRKARVIIPINLRYTYTVSPLAPIENNIKELSTKFSQRFPTIPPLHKLLKIMSIGKPKPFIMHVPSPDHREAYKSVLPFLLQNDLIVHLSTFALIVITRKVKIAAIQAQADVDEKNNDASETRVSLFKLKIDEIQDSIIRDPRNCSPIEKVWLRQLMKTKNSESSQMFSKLSKYFNGRDCLEQVMIHEQISVDAMREFLNDYGQYLVTFKHW